MMHNNLFIQRLLIYTEKEQVAYDENFHPGVNIIRGDNSSGKSTITHFIFFVLGGAFNDFVPEALLCDRVYAQVKMNNAVFTIKRYLTKTEKGEVNTKTPIHLFWGDLEESLNPPSHKTWEKFSYNSSPDKKSFSNILFDRLGIPIVKGDNNISMHQILRLLYIDQESPTSSLFLYENFDSQLTRETVSELLLGVYDEELYDNKKRLISEEKENEIIKNEIKITQKFFSNIKNLDSNYLKKIIQDKEQEINTIENEIIEIRNKNKEADFDENSKLEFQKLNDEVISQRLLTIKIENEINSLDSEIEDSNYFIEALNNKIKAIKNSIETRSFLGNLPLNYCPECLTRIKQTNDSSKCKLCKEEIDESFGIIQARRMQAEISYQISESEKLLGLSKKEHINLRAKNEVEKLKLLNLQKQVNTALKDVRTYNQEKLDSLNNRKGFIEGEILQFRTMIETSERYKMLLDKKDSIKQEIERLKLHIENAEKRQLYFKREIETNVKKEGLYLLNNDLDRQEEFKNANDFHIDYSNNLAFLSNKYSKYSASSNFYLKVTARFSLFLASLSLENMRFPRFIFADNMEDKGIEQKRAQNLQKILIERTQRFNPNSFQIIYTTSYITEELNESPYVVGEYYTKANPSLKNINKPQINKL